MSVQREVTHLESGSGRLPNVSRNGVAIVRSRFSLAFIVAAAVLAASMTSGSVVRASQLNDEQTLYHFGHLALRGLEPWVSDRQILLNQADRAWRWGAV